MVPKSERDFRLSLVASSDEADPRDSAYQNELRDVEQALRDEGLDIAVGSGFQKSANLGSWLTGDFIVHVGAAATFVSVAAKSLVPVLVEWVKGRAGRKVRLKKGDIEIEAQTPDEIERLWKVAAEDDEQP
jgi:hypothetical protein